MRLSKLSRFILPIAILVMVILQVGCSPAASVTATVAPTTETTAEVTTQATTEATIETTVEVTTEATAEVIITATTAPTTEATVEASAEASASLATTCTKLNLNTVTQDALLTTIPEFSNRMVREFLEYRPYASIQEFRREIGKYVDDAQVTTYEDYVFVPVDVNNSDADTLQQLAGVDATIAQTLIAGRPYADNDAFLTALTPLVTTDELAVASCYLG